MQGSWWWDGMNRPLQVSADCLAFFYLFFFPNACAPLACIHLFPCIYPRLKICSPSNQRVIKLRRWTVQNTANQSSCDQGGTFACNCGGQEGEGKKGKENTLPLFSCASDQTRLLVTLHLCDQMFALKRRIIDERRSDTQQKVLRRRRGSAKSPRA